MLLKKILKKIVRNFLSVFIIGDVIKYQTRNKNRRFVFRYRDIYPCLRDRTWVTGFDRHYVYHIAWALRKLRQINPKKHVDISSSLYFVGAASAFMPVQFFDYRPAELILDNLSCDKADLLSLPFSDNSQELISCLHVIEHIGLGRYGEPIDPEADIKAMNELSRVVKCGGDLLIVVPVGGVAKIEYNAHRIYTRDMVLRMVTGFELVEFSYIPEYVGGIIKDAKQEDIADGYGCGCFHFKKIC